MTSAEAPTISRQCHQNQLRPRLGRMITWRNNQYPIYTKISLRSGCWRYRILLGCCETNLQKITTQGQKVLGVLQEQCCFLSQQGQHHNVSTLFREGVRLHAWLSPPSLGSGRRKRRSQEFWAQWKNAENLQIPQGCTYLWWWFHLTGDERMHHCWLNDENGWLSASGVIVASRCVFLLCDFMILRGPPEGLENFARKEWKIK